jgi:hypothetical protein
MQKLIKNIFSKLDFEVERWKNCDFTSPRNDSLRFCLYQLFYSWIVQFCLHIFHAHKSFICAKSVIDAADRLAAEDPDVLTAHPSMSLCVLAG